MIEIILASSSPRRKQLLSEIIKQYTIICADADENVSCRLAPSRYVMTLAKRKAKAIKAPSQSLVIGADTTVYMLGKYYGKPTDSADAERILGELNGNVHHVYTGVCLLYMGKTVTFYVRSAVTFNKLSPQQITQYVRQFQPLDKAGAYAIQDNVLVKDYKGSYTNIIGLPLERLKIEITKLIGELL